MRIGRRSILIASLCLLLPLAAGAASAVGHSHSQARIASALPYMGKQPSPSLFGIDTGTFDNVHSHFVKDFSVAKHLGARWLHYTGDSIHWVRGKANYGTLDYEVTQARKRGLGVMISLGGDPHACSVKPQPSDFTNCPPTTHHDFRAYKKFLRQELLRYRKNVTYFESWVEPNHAGRWPPHPNPKQYAKLLKVQYGVLQSVNRGYHLDLKLLFGASNGFSIAPGSAGGLAVLPFTHAVLGYLGGKREFDGISLHAYRYPPESEGPDATAYDNVQGIGNGPYPNQGCRTTGTWCQMTWSQELSAYEQEFRNHGYPQEPLWLSEFGWPGTNNPPKKGQPGYQPGYFPSESTQAKYLREAYGQMLQLPFMQGALWFNLRDYKPGLANPDPPFFSHYGLLEYNYNHKPAADIFSTLARSYKGH